MKLNPIVRTLSVAFGGLALLAQPAFAQQQPASPPAQPEAQKLDRIEVTGSRLRRADTEGALPITVIDRVSIEASGSNSVSELLRTITFSSFGNTRPQSGSSAQALSDVDLRGLGSNRTLVLVDGRRISKAPFSGQAQDLNSVPLAMVERIEILSDGASAVYGSDAIGGVVNIITRKNFNGVLLNYGRGNPETPGSDTEEYSLIWGASSRSGRMFAGISGSERDIAFTRNQQGYIQGVSSFGNNYRRVTATRAPTGAFAPVPGYACADPNFFFTNPGGEGNTCSFNFNESAANDAKIGTKGIFANGEFNINDNWAAYMSASVANVDSFGRYAPTPAQVFLPAGSATYNAITAATPGLAAASPTGLSLRHRFAAAGTRDNSTDAIVTSTLGGIKGRLADRFDIDVGMRYEKYKFKEAGVNYIVRPLAETAIVNGTYDIFAPFANDPSVLNSIKATITRDSTWIGKEVYASASTELFKIDGRAVTSILGIESRSENLNDQYDSLQEAGVIEGASGNSSGGGRTIKSVFFEVSVPVLKNLELSFAGRHDKYSDAGGAFSPKVSARYQPIKDLTLRGSFGNGFRAPTLDVLTQKDSYSADSIQDFATCRSFGGTEVFCNAAGRTVQVDGTVIANAALRPEKSKQFSLGVVYDPLPWLNLSLDYYNIAIKNRIVNISAQTLVNRTRNPVLGPIPAGLGVTIDPATNAVIGVTRGAGNEGTLDANGFDFKAGTDFKLGGYGRLETRLILSVSNEYVLDGGINQIGLQGAPKTRWNLENRWSYKDFTATLNSLYIGEQPDALNDGDASTKAYLTHNLNLVYKHPSKLQFTLGINNITGKLPEIIGYDGRPWNYGLYEAYGRQLYFRVQAQF
jgi:iron complex outermembrane recepter protein